MQEEGYSELPHEQLHFLVQVQRYLTLFIISLFSGHSRIPFCFQLKQPQAISLHGYFTVCLVNMGSNLSKPGASCSNPTCYHSKWRSRQT